MTLAQRPGSVNLFSTISAEGEAFLPDFGAVLRGGPFLFVQDGPGRASPVAAWWAMRHSRIALTAVLALALAGCATTPSRPLDYPPGAFYTPDGKPKVLPCMAGGLLCSPQG